jgi:methyl-accepting chemotaxis protein
MKLLIEYLRPDNLIARGVVNVLVALFILWIAYLLYQFIYLVIQRMRISKCADVDFLSEVLYKLVNPEEEGAEKDKKEASEKKDEDKLITEGEKMFSGFCRNKGLKKEGVLAGHIKAIFEAGIRESRLDIGELIKHTQNALFRGNALLKSVMASFIVLGLLGTLVGLADSLAELKPVLAKGAVERTAADLSSGLSALFTHLKTAFAPSIWGVLLTVIGVLLFSLYLRCICYPVRKKIENLTLTVWVPKLYLTTTQRLVGTLKVSEKQLQETMQDIKHLASAEGVGKEVKDLQKNLKGANETIEKLDNSAGEMQNFTSNFVSGVKKLSEFQGDLQTLYNQMIDESKVFKESVQKSMEQARGFQTNAAETFKIQNQQLQGSYEQLSSYEAAYVAERQNIDVKMQELLDSARNAYEKLGERNDEVLKSLGSPMNEKLEEMGHNLRVELNAITKGFNTFSVPMKEAADKIEVIVDSFDDRTSAVTKEMSREFTTQHERINQDLEKLITKIESYSNELSNTNLNQVQHSETLGKSVSTLSSNVEKLDGSFNSFDEYTKSEKEKIDKQIIKLTKDMHKEFISQNKDTNERLEGLFKKFENYDTQLTDTNRIQGEQAKALGENLSTFSGSINQLNTSITTLAEISGKRDDTMEKLKPLSDVANQMGTLVQQLKSSSLKQEKQNQVMAAKMDNMTESLRLLARGIGEKGYAGKAEEALGKGDNVWPDKPQKHPFFNWERSPVRRLLRKLFG